MNLLIPYIKAGYPVIYLQTAEENRAEITVLEAAKGCQRNLIVWSHTQGFFTPGDDDNFDDIEDPVDALENILTRFHNRAEFVGRMREGVIAISDDGTIVVREWDFGDGGTSNLPVVSHIYRTDGSFTVSLTVAPSLRQVNDAFGRSVTTMLWLAVS